MLIMSAEYSCTEPAATAGLSIHVEEYRTMPTSDNPNGEFRRIN